MKYFIAIAALALAGCASVGTPTVPNLQTAAVKACAVIQPMAVSLQSMPSQLTPQMVSDLAIAVPKINAFCAAPAVPATASDIIATAFPLIIQIVDASKMSASDKQTTLSVLTVTQVGLSVALAQ